MINKLISLPDLIDFAWNEHSQNGEDGIIQEVCRRLNISAGWFVEFGAWDGKYLSNTFRLVKQGWKGVYIESDPQRFQLLQNTGNEYSGQIETVNAHVDWRGKDVLDNLLEKTSIPSKFDILSIDIDSYDWHVWYSIERYRPTVVIIECNSTILPGIWQIHQEGVCQGSSFSALLALGESKKYRLASHTGNLIFVVEEQFDLLRINPIFITFPELMFNYRKYNEETADATPSPIPPKSLKWFSLMRTRILQLWGG